MKGNVTKDYFYTGDYYGFTREEVELEGSNPVTTFFEYTYFYSRKVKMNLSISLIGDLVIVSPEKLQLNGKIKNIVDAAGEEIYEDAEWTIYQTAPLLGPLGLKEGYQYRAEITAGNL